MNWPFNIEKVQTVQVSELHVTQTSYHSISLCLCLSSLSLHHKHVHSIRHVYTLTHTLTQRGQRRGSNWLWKKIVFCNYFPATWPTWKILPTRTEAISFLLKVSDTLITPHRGRFEMHNPSPTRFLVCVYLIISPITTWISLEMSQRQFVKECRNPWTTCSLTFLFVTGEERSWLTGGLTQWLNKMGNGTWRKCKGRSSGSFLFTRRTSQGFLF